MSDKASIIKEAQKFLAKGQIDKAITEWEKLLQMSPDAASFNFVGDLYLKKGDKANATEKFHKTAEIFRTEGFSLKALAIYKKILNVNPSDARSLYALGELSEEKNIATDAIRYYLAAGDLYIKDNKKGEASAAYGKVARLAPNNLQLRKKIAELYSKEGFAEETSTEYAEIARILEDQGDIDEAMGYLERALEIKPSNRDALLRLASLHENRGDSGKAVEYLKLAITRTGKTPELILRLARLCMGEALYQEAREYAQALMQANPQDADAKRIIAESFFREGNVEAAWTEYSPVLDELIFKNELDEAAQILGMFKEVEPVEAGRKLVTLYKKKGDNGAAARELVELGEMLEAGSMQEEALGCYKEARSINPGDEYVARKIEELEPQEETGEGAAGEKTAEEVLAEAGVFLGYGLFEEARAVLEPLKLREPGNIELHLKLKTIYAGTGDTEQAVTECIILSELYKRAGETGKKEAIIKEAFALDPADPRLVERFGPGQAAPVEEVPEAPGTGAEEQTGVDEDFAVLGNAAPGTAGSGDYGEELAEADFYKEQGLYEEAGKIYRSFLSRQPNDETLKARLEELEALKADASVHETVASGAEQSSASADNGLTADGDLAEGSREEAGRVEAEAGAGQDFQNMSLEDALNAEDVQEPALDNDVLEIFQEFKKGLEKELEVEDTETHYNLGIAYKEMGLIDDAIREFQIVQHDPKLFINASTMLGICYMDKGLYPLAVEALQSALMKVGKKDEAQWGLKYDLALAYEKNGEPKAAFEFFMEVYGHDSKFREVAKKINSLKEKTPGAADDKPAPEKHNDTQTKKNRVSYI
ncbi:MAG: tetratricopeptide repeat protein [Nitrospiraceae bacterium]|nr:tetratricopeptide repeat protein [Nitrospiraceae bacterium]